MDPATVRDGMERLHREWAFESQSFSAPEDGPSQKHNNFRVFFKGMQKSASEIKVRVVYGVL